MGFFDWLFGRKGGAEPTSSSTAPRTQTPVQAPSAGHRAPVSPPQMRPPAFAVIDVETTGLSPKTSRVLELAIVRVDLGGRIVDEWTTRFNPEGPVGATHIHGIRQADVDGAPFFRDLAPTIATGLRGMPIVAHNARFDLAFMRAEFAAAGWQLPWLESFCTMEGSYSAFPSLGRRRLIDCCWAAGVTLNDAHSALGDARATAGLLGAYIARGNGELLRLPEAARRTQWPDAPSSPPRPYAIAPARNAATSRRVSPPRPAQLTLVQQLAGLSVSDIVSDSAPAEIRDYAELMLEVLEDGEITRDEAEALAELRAEYDLTEQDAASVAESFLLALARKAVDDGVVTRAERVELNDLAETLGVDAKRVKTTLDLAEAARHDQLSRKLRPLPSTWSLGDPLRVGDRVAFTGCDDRVRDRLERSAMERGVKVTGSVSRVTDLLVTDGEFAGTKLSAAREYGTRIVHPDDFSIMLKHLQPKAVASASNTREAAAPAAGRSSARVAGIDSTPSTPDSNGAETSTVASATPSEIRAWALRNGFEVSPRGRLPKAVMTAFEESGGALGTSTRDEAQSLKRLSAVRPVGDDLMAE